MPLYEYECQAHGVFEDQRPIAKSHEEGTCPECRAAAPRIVSAPNLACMERSQVKARDRNEKSKHEPRVVEAPTKVGSAPSGRPRLETRGGGYPWALGH